MANFQQANWTLDFFNSPVIWLSNHFSPASTSVLESLHWTRGAVADQVLLGICLYISVLIK